MSVTYSRGAFLLGLLSFFAVSCGGGVRTQVLNSYLVRASASTASLEFPAEYAFDGDTNTRWSSEFADSQWIAASFDREVSVETIALRWETARSRDFAVDLEVAEGAWEEVADRLDRPDRDLVDVLVLATPRGARGLRIRCKRRATEWGNSLWEVTVMGTASGEPPEPNLVGWQKPLTPEEQREMEVGVRLLAAAAADPLSSAGMSDEAFLDLVQKRAFDFFWHESDEKTGLTLDRVFNFAAGDRREVASVASVGFALAGYPIGVERGWVTRDSALARTLATLRNFADGPIRNVDGFFPHFVHRRDGRDMPGTEISTIDSLLFLCGALVASEYFQDEEVTRLVERIHKRMEWHRARLPSGFISMGQDTPGHYMPYEWGSADNEGILLILASLGHPTRPEPVSAWEKMQRPVGEYAGHRFVAGPWGYPSIFRYQYPNLFVDFRGLVDEHGLDHGENLTRATLAMRDYCIAMSETFPASFGPDMWGLGAADGLENRYIIHGFPPGHPPVEGTVVVYGIAGSLAHLPAHGIRALRAIYDGHREAWGRYGFTDALNPGEKFVTQDVIGIDQGTVLLGIENFRTGLPWRLFHAAPPIRAALARLGWDTVVGPRHPAGSMELHGSAGWKFRAGDGAFASTDLPEEGWRTVLVPDREAFGAGASPRIGWYRHSLVLDSERLSAWRRAAAARPGRAITFRSGGIADGDVVYVNGVKIGSTEVAPGSDRAYRCYVVAPEILRVGRNVVAVRVASVGSRGGIWAAPVALGPQPEPFAWGFLSAGAAVDTALLAGMKRQSAADLGSPDGTRLGAWEAKRAVIKLEALSGGRLRVRYDVSVPGSFGGFWTKPTGVDASAIAGVLVTIAGEGGAGDFSPVVHLDLKTASAGYAVDLGPISSRPRTLFVPRSAFSGRAPWEGSLTELTMHWNHADARVPRGSVVISNLEIVLRR